MLMLDKLMRGKLYRCGWRKTWKFLSAAVLTYDHSFVSARGVVWGKSVVAVATVCVCVCVCLCCQEGLQWQADESVGVYRDEP